ncbi:uncharacterized protein LOC134208419 [Armigeres subalbatus]|uniref:uncharacterized protein LOC134208419 n=1 Tax=Armigeres subalbatus TaxID=124917 RepID=UPI002ED1FB15
MNWIILGVVFILAPQLRPDPSSLAESSPSASLIGSLLQNGGQLAAVQGTPLSPDSIPASLRALNPFIKHWEPARFDRSQLEAAHRHHEAHRRRRRSVNYDHGSASYGPANVVRLNFHAHDREFRLVLREDPSSVFARDVQIDDTEGPVDFDLSRVYTGIVEVPTHNTGSKFTRTV